MNDNPFVQRLTAKEIQSLENAGMIGDNVITFFLGMLVLEQMKKADADREWVILNTFFFAKLYEQDVTLICLCNTVSCTQD